MTTFANMKVKLLLIISLLLNVLCAGAQVDSVNVMFGRSGRLTIPVNACITNREFNLNRLHHSFSLAAPVAVIGFAMMPGQTIPYATE